MLIRSSLLSLILVGGAVQAETVQPLMVIEDHVQQLADDNLELRLKLMVITPGGVNLTMGIGKGTWLIGKGSTPGFNKAGHQITAGDDLVAADGRIRGTIMVTVNPDQWVPADKEVHEIPVTVDLQIDKSGGDPLKWTITGTASAPTLDAEGTIGAVTEGTVSGQAVLPVSPGYFSMGHYDDGLALDFNMGSQRVNWNRFQAVRHTFREPLGMTALEGLRLRVATDSPRADASVSVWLREEDGSWYYAKDVVPLIDGSNSGTAWFDDFTSAEWVAPGSHLDEDWSLDRRAIAEMAIGVVNPFGIGTVSFTVEDISTVDLGDVTPDVVTAAVTGKTLSVNDQDLVPAGLFGGYAPYLPAKYRPGTQRAYFTLPRGGPTPPEGTEWFRIDMWGDRTQPATLLNDKNWRQTLTKAANDYANRAKKAPHQTVLEFWNEPYLDWAKGKNYNPNFFDTSKAVDGGEVYSLNYPGVIPHLRWRSEQVLKGKDTSTDKIGRVKVPRGKKPGDTFTAKVTVRKKIDGKNKKVKEDRTFEVVEQQQWKVFDETQFTYWSARANGYIYDTMATLVAKTIKDISPETPIAVGWGFRWSEDHWAAWDLLYKPTIDNTIEWIDGVHEHHYQGDVTAMHGTYEVLTAYGMAAHDKWLYSYNTETNDLLDVPARGYVDTQEKADKAKGFRQLIYNMRDCLYGVYTSPDKYRSRTVIHVDHQKKATEIAYGLMANLRGRLVHTETSDEDVWVVSSIDGTDPISAPADGQPRLVTFLWNDAREARTVSLVIDAPTGTSMGEGTVEKVVLDRDTYDFGIETSSLATDGKRATIEVEIPPRRPVKVSFPLDGTPVDSAEVTRRQFFADDILKPVSREGDWTTAVKVPSEARQGAKRAWLRCVVESVSEGEAKVKIGSFEVTVPSAITGSNVCRIREIAIPLEMLADEVPITFSLAEGNHAGYLVNMASLVIER